MSENAPMTVDDLDLSPPEIRGYSPSGVPRITIADAERIVLSQLIARAVNNPEVPAEVKKRLGAFDPESPGLIDPRSLPGLYLESGPGIGKTTILETASRKFCELAGLQFVKDPPADFVIDKHEHFIFNVIRFAGVNSPTQIGAIPTVRSLGSDKSKSGQYAHYPDNSTTQSAFNNMLSLLAATQKGMDFEESNSVHVRGDKAEMKFRLSGSPGQIESCIASATAQYRKHLEKSGLDLMDANLNPGKDSPISFECRVVSQDKNTGQVQVDLVVRQPDLTFKNASSQPKTTEILPGKALAQLRDDVCLYGAFVLDDLGQAHQAIRGIALELMLDGRGFDTRMGCGVMGMASANLGAADGTAAGQFGKITAAETTRVSRYEIVADALLLRNYLEQKLEKSPPLRALVEKAGGPDVACSHFLSFLELYPDIIKPDAGDYRKGGPLCTPRSLEAVLNIALSNLSLARNWHKMPDGSHAPLGMDAMTQAQVAATVGEQAASRLATHIEAMRSEAQPCARQLLRSMKELDLSRPDWPSAIRLPRVYAEKGGNFMDADSKDFGFRLSYALSDSLTAELMSIADKAKRNAAPDARQTYSEQVQDFMRRAFTLASALSYERAPAGVDLQQTNLSSGAFPRDLVNLTLTRLSTALTTAHARAGLSESDSAELRQNLLSSTVTTVASLCTKGFLENIFTASAKDKPPVLNQRAQGLEMLSSFVGLPLDTVVAAVLENTKTAQEKPQAALQAPSQPPSSARKNKGSNADPLLF